MFTFWKCSQLVALGIVYAPFKLPCDNESDEGQVHTEGENTRKACGFENRLQSTITYPSILSVFFFCIGHRERITRHRGNRYLTSLRWSAFVAMATANLVKVAIKFYLECELRFPGAQFMLRQLYRSNLSVSFEVKYWVSWLISDVSQTWRRAIKPALHSSFCAITADSKWTNVDRTVETERISCVNVPQPKMK